MAKRERTALLVALAFVGCAGRPIELAPIAPTPTTPEVSGEAAARPSTIEPPSEAEVEPAAPTPTPPPSDDRLVVEPAYAPSAFPWPRDADERKALVAELERWNAGGVAEGERWHAAPRVVIGEPIVLAGKTSARDLMRVLRREQYWSVRRCYEPRLREHPTLEGRTVLRLSIASDGTVRAATTDHGRMPDDRKHGRAMSDRDVLDCLARSFRGIRVPAPRSRSATIRVSIDVWPGDAPLPLKPGPEAHGKLELGKVDDAVNGARADLSTCFGKATRGAWGRLALRVDVGADGHVDEIGEVESTFPDTEVTTCVTGVLRALALPRPTDGEARVIVALRWSPR